MYDEVLALCDEVIHGARFDDDHHLNIYEVSFSQNKFM